MGPSAPWSQHPLERLLGRLAGRLAAEGVEAFLTGGFLRDILLGRPVDDIDIAVRGDTAAAARVLASAFPRSPIVSLDEERRIHRLVLPDDQPVRNVDITPLAGDIDSDLRRRDFTIDALAAPLAPGLGLTRIIDPFDGRKDLDRRLVRALGPHVFAADGLRLLRGVRLAAEMGFALEEETARWILEHGSDLKASAPERQRDELLRLLATPRGSWGLREMDRLGLLERVLPEVTATRGVQQPKEHYWDVFDHSLETVEVLDHLFQEHVPADMRWASFWRELWGPLAWISRPHDHFREELVEGHRRLALVKLAGLLHDVAKPEAKAPDRTGRIRFLGHAALGAEKAEAVMRRLRFGSRERDLVCLLVKEHLRPGQMSPPKADGPPSRRALFRFFRDLGDAAFDLLVLSLADHLAARGPRMRLTSWRGHVAFVNQVLARRYGEESLVEPPRLLTGHDVMAELGLPPGPLVGEILRAIEEAQGAGEISSREEALDLARAFLGRMDKGSRRAVPGGAPRGRLRAHML